MDKRPYGEGAAEIAAARERAATEGTTAAATPRRGRSGGQQDPGVTNPGHMGTPPQDEPKPEPPSVSQVRAPRSVLGLDQSSNPAEAAPPPTPQPRTPQQRINDMTTDWEKRAREGDARRTDMWNQVLGFKDALGSFLAGGKEEARLTPKAGESKEDYQARVSAQREQGAAGAREVAGQAAGLIGAPFTIVAQEAEVAVVQSDPRMASEYGHMVDSLPDELKGSPAARAAAAHAVLDSTTAQFIRAIDDPRLSDAEKRAAFAGASALVLLRVTELGGPQIAQSIGRLGIKAVTTAAKPPTVVFALGRDSEDVTRLTAMSQRLRAIGAHDDAAAADAEIARINKINDELTTSVEKQRAAEAPPPDDGGPPPLTAEEQAKVTPKKGAAAAPPRGMRIGDAVVRKNPGTGALERVHYKTGEPIPEDTTPGAAPPGQRGAAPPGQPTTATTPKPVIPAGEPNLGINLGKVDAPQHVKDLIEVEARAHIEDITAQRRGVQHLEATYAWARNLGIDVPSIAQVRAGTAINAEGLVALQGAIVKTAAKRVALEQEIQAAGVLATPEQEARWLAAAYEQNTLQRVFAGGRAESGRSMRALRELSDGVNSGQIKDTYSSALEAIGGKPNFDKLMQRLKDIQLDPLLDPRQKEIAQYKLVAALDGARFWDKINEVYINSILSNPLTHTGNILGQSALHEAETLARFPAAVFDAIVSGGGRLRPRQRTVTGAVVQAVAGHAATKRAVSEALIFMRDGIAAESIQKFREGASRGSQGYNAIGGKVGTVIGLPTRALAAEDVFFNRLGYNRQLWEDAANYVARDGKDSIFSRQFWTRAADVAEHPGDFLMDNVSIHERAAEAGRRAGLRQDPGALARALITVRDMEIPKTGGLAPLRFVAPFVGIGFKLLRVGAEYSPAGFLRVPFLRTPGARADAYGRAVIGEALWAIMWKKADAGEITGAAPTDPQERAQFYDSGKRPYAIKVGQKWVEFGRLEPIATTLKWVQGIHDAMPDIEQGIQDPRLLWSAAVKSTFTIARALSDSSFLSWMQDFHAMLQGPSPEAAGERFAGNLVNSLIPYSGMRRFIAQGTDPTLRSASGVIEQIEAATPGLSRNVRPFLDHWGEAAQQPERSGGLYQQQIRTDPVDATLQSVFSTTKLTVDGQEIDPLHISVQLVQADIDGLKLSKDEGFMLQQAAGRATHAALADLFTSKTPVKTEDGRTKSWSEMDERERRFATQSTISEARRTARATVADAILLDAKNDGEVERAASMRLSTLSKVSQRASFLAGLERQGRLTPPVRRYLNDHRGKGERTVEQYVSLGGG